jgi:hypothetical protein
VKKRDENGRKKALCVSEKKREIKDDSPIGRDKEKR